MGITPRMKQIFQILLHAPGAVSIQGLAGQIGVSKRTVQRELESIDVLLRPYGLEFASKTGVGVWIAGSQEGKERLLAACSAGDAYDAGNKEERRKRLVLEILREKGLRKLFAYSSQFGVSEATVSNDLEAVEGWLGQHGLKVVRKPGSGISIEGSEESYRRAIRAFIHENLESKAARGAYQDEAHGLWGKNSIGKMLDDGIVRGVMNCIARVDQGKVLAFTESAYQGLVIHISIAINRILKDEVIESVEGWEPGDIRDRDYQLAKEIVEELEKEFPVSIPEMEVSYICLHIKGAKHQDIQWGGRKELGTQAQKLQQLVNGMVDAFDPGQAYLMKQDDEFIQGLLAHLQPTLIRLEHGMQIQNPVLDDIKVCYPEIFNRCTSVAEVLGSYIGKKVPEQEIGFLTVHFGAALIRLEGRKEEIRKVQAGVVCSSGIGISRLMLSKLQKIFRDRMQLVSYSRNDVTPYIASKTDFFISSIPMEVEDAPVVSVNPLLDEEDVERIQQMVYKYERLPRKQKETDGFSAQLEEINRMATQIKNIIQAMDLFWVKNQIQFDRLLAIVAEKMSPYLDCQEKIQEDLFRRERIASQVFAEFGFALLHARTKGVERPVFSICLTEDGGAFEDPYMKRITKVFVMLVPDDGDVKTNNEIMGYISSMLIEEYEFMEVVARGEKEEIRSVLSRNLKKYFGKYIARMS